MCGRAETAEKGLFPAAETSLVTKGESPRLPAASDFSNPLVPPPPFSSSPAPMASCKVSLHSRKHLPF